MLLGHFGQQSRGLALFFLELVQVSLEVTSVLHLGFLGDVAGELGWHFNRHLLVEVGAR